MATEYPVKMTVTLKPVQCPHVVLTAGKIVYKQQLSTTTSFDFEFCAVDQASLMLEHHSKSDLDADTAVIIQRIEFYGISDPRFIWAGTYYPEYPSHYADQKSSRPGQDYLGWNGTYVLKFQVPVFTWIHQVQGLGWLYQ
jgi:hypothetical protein